MTAIQKIELKDAHHPDLLQQFANKYYRKDEYIIYQHVNVYYPTNISTLFLTVTNYGSIIPILTTFINKGNKITTQMAEHIGKKKLSNDEILILYSILNTINQCQKSDLYKSDDQLYSTVGTIMREINNHINYLSVNSEKNMKIQLENIYRNIIN